MERKKPIHFRKMTKKQRERNDRSLSTFIYKILKTTDEQMGISNAAMATMNSIAFDFFNRLMGEARRLSQSRPTTTLLPATINAALRLLVPAPRTSEMLGEVIEAMTKYNARASETEKPSKKSPAMSRSYRAGLTFPVGRIMRMMKHKWKHGIVRAVSAIAVAAACEHAVKMVLERAVKHTAEMHRNRVIPRDIMMALRADPVLDVLFPGIVAKGGVLPNIHSVLLPGGFQAAAPKLDTDNEDD